MSPLALVTLGAGALFGLGQVARFEKSAALDIANLLTGPGKSVKVRSTPFGPLGYAFGDLSRATISASNFETKGLPLYTEPWRSKKGRLRELHLDLRNFKLGDLEVERIDAKIPNCRFDLAYAISAKKVRLSHSGVGLGEVWLTEDALERFILKKFTEIKDVTVRCDRGYVWVEGRGEFLVIETQFRVLAKLESPDGFTIVLTKARIAFDGLPVDAAVGQTVLDTLNPVVDLRKDLQLLDAVSISEIDARDGQIRAKAHVKIPTRPGSQPLSG